MPAAKPKNTLPINTPLNLQINIDCPESYLLLFNRGKDYCGNIKNLTFNDEDAIPALREIQQTRRSLYSKNSMQWVQSRLE